MIREGSAAKNLKPLLPIINAHTAQFCCFAADDRHPADLLTEGHINYMVKTAVQEGIPLPMALQMATINAARYFGLKDIGAIAPRYKADILVFDNLNDWQPELVFKDGSIVAKNKKAEFVRDAVVPNKIKETMHIAPIIKEKLQIKAAGGRANVIGLVPHQIVTKHLKVDVQVTDGYVCLPKGQDLLKLAVFERHSATGNIGVGLVEGFGLADGAIASTIAHDSHNLIAIGKNDEDIIKAAEELKKIKGGVVIVKNGEVVGELPLPIAGLMSEQSAADVEGKLAQLKEIAYKMGVLKDYDPFLTLAFLSLPVIPELKLTDLGLVDVSSFSFIPLMENNKI